MGLEAGGGTDGRRRRRRRRRNFCICESIGHRPLRGRCPKRKEGRRGEVRNGREERKNGRNGRKELKVERKGGRKKERKTE